MIGLQHISKVCFFLLCSRRLLSQEMEHSLQSERYGCTIMTGLLWEELLIHRSQSWLDPSKLLIFLGVLNRRACQPVILSPLFHNKKWSKHEKEIIFAVFAIHFKRSYKVMSIIWKASCALHSSLFLISPLLKWRTGWTSFTDVLNFICWFLSLLPRKICTWEP